MAEKVAVDFGYKRGTTNTRAKKFVKGACKNCGALTHSAKDCFERPRKLGAQFTNADIAPNDYQQPDVDFDYDAKRDRWANYDIEQHDEILRKHSKIEEVIFRLFIFDIIKKNISNKKRAFLEDNKILTMKKRLF